jgi:hypothetical protein
MSIARLCAVALVWSSTLLGGCANMASGNTAGAQMSPGNSCQHSTRTPGCDNTKAIDASGAGVPAAPH